MKVPLPQAGSSARWRRGSVTSSRTIACASQLGGVVLAQGAAFRRGDDGFVEDGGDVRRRAGAVFARPVKARQAAGQGLQQGIAAVHLAGPGEKVGGDDAAQPGGLLEGAPVQQVGGVGCRRLPDVHAEGGLHGDAHHQAEVGMADEQVVQFVGLAGDFAQGGGQQVVPEAALDADGFQPGGAGVEAGQGADVALAGGAGRAQVLLHRLAVGWNAIQGKEGVVPQPFVEGQPAVGGFQGKEPGARQSGRAGVGPAQQPALAVGEDAHADALAGGAGLRQVVVQLGYIGRGRGRRRRRCRCGV